MIRRQLHAWFDEPGCHDLCDLALRNGLDGYEMDRNSIRSVRDPWIEGHGDDLPHLFGPIYRSLPEGDEVVGRMEAIAERLGADRSLRSTVQFFEMRVGPKQMHLSFRLEGATFRASSEKRTDTWLSTESINFDRPPRASATEEAIAGGMAEYLADHLRGHPISSLIEAWEIDEQRAGILAMGSLAIINTRIRTNP